MATAFEAILANLASTQQYRATALGYKAQAAEATAQGKLSAALAKSSAWKAAQKKAEDEAAKAAKAVTAAPADPYMALALSVMRNAAPAPVPPPTAAAVAPEHHSLIGNIFHDIGHGGKWVLDQLQRTGQAVGGALDAATGGSETHGEGVLEAAKKGFLNEEHVNPDQLVYRAQKALDSHTNPHPNKAQRIATGATDFSLGLAADVALDPLSYVGIGLLTKPGRALGLIKGAKTAAEGAEGVTDAAKAIEAGPRAVAPAAAKALPQGDLKAIGSGSVAGDGRDSIRKLSERLSAAQQATPSGPARFSAGASGLADRINPVDLVNDQVAQQITQAVRAAPKLQYPGLTIDRPFEDVTKKVTKRVATGTTKVPELAPVAGAAPKQVSAVRLLLLHAPDHVIPGMAAKGSGRSITVGDLLDTAAKSSPARRREIQKIIEKEATRIAKTGKLTGLPEKIQFLGRSGNPVPVELDQKQVLRLFTKGQVPAVLKDYGAEGTEEFLSGFPLHSTDDLKALHVRDEFGDLTSLHAYMRDAKVPLQAVHPVEGARTVLKGGAPDLYDLPVFSEPKQVMKTKTIYENQAHDVTSTVRMKGAKALAWQLKYTDKLTPEELKYVSDPKLTPEQFAERVRELQVKTVAGNHTTLQSFIAAAENGEIPQAYLDNVFATLGVKSLKELETKASEVIKRTGATKEAKLVGREARPGASVAEPKVWDQVKKNVMSPDQIIEKVNKEGPSVLARSGPVVTKTIAYDVAEAVHDAVNKNLRVPTDAAGAYRYRSKTGTLRTAAQLKEGVGRNLKGWNAYSQGDALGSLLNTVSRRLRAATLGTGDRKFWRQRPGEMYSQVMPALRVLENQLRDEGVKIIAGSGEDGVMMSMGDVLESLPRELVEKHVFRAPGGKSATIRPHAIIASAEPLITAALHDGNLDLAKAASLQAVMDTKAGSYGAKGEAGLKAAHEWVGGLVKSLPTLLQRVNANYAEEAIKVGASVTSMSNQVVDKLLTSYQDTASSIETTAALLMHADNELRAAATELNAPAEAVPLAKMITSSKLVDGGVDPGDLAEAKAAKPVSKVNATKTRRAQYDSRVSEAQVAGGQVPQDVDDLANLYTESGLWRAYSPVAGKLRVFGELAGRAFVSDYGFPSLHEAMWVSRNTNTSIAMSARQLLYKISDFSAKTFGKNARSMEQQAFRTLQMSRGVIGASNDPGVTKLMEAMKSATDFLFDAGETSDAGIAVRNGLYTHHLNSMLGYYGVPKAVRFEAGKPLKDQVDAWQHWDVEDPLDVLGRVVAAHQFALTDQAVGRSFTKMFSSAVPREGYVKVTDSKKQSILTRFLDPDRFYDEKVVAQIPYYDAVRRAGTSRIKNKTLDALVHNVYDRALHGFKTGVTVVRPGHHVSNLMGDLTLNMIAGVNNPMVYRKATAVLAGRSGLYHDWDGLRALQADEALHGAPATGRVRVGRRGRLGELSGDAVWRAAYRQGLLPEFHVIQDLSVGDATAHLKPGTSKLTAPIRAWVKAGGKTADVISHTVRMAQFIDMLQKSKAKTVEEAVAEAGRAVRKWHPDGTDLTPIERKYAKRLIPFYSWWRKSTPLIMEAILTRPGRVAVMPKAMYNLAQTMGTNPDSLANPFPPDKMLPSFILDQIYGSQWNAGNHLYGMTLPGDPVAGTLTTLNNPLASLASGITPALKVPLELMRGDGDKVKGRTLGSNIPIKDYSDYADQQIPGVSYLSNITNRSVTGLGAPQAGSDGGMDKQALLNFLTGLGVRDYDKPSYKAASTAELRKKYSKTALGGR